MTHRHNSIQSRAMIATLNMSRWSGTRTDRKVSADVANQHRVDEKRAGYYRKHLIDPKTPSLTALTEAYGSMRRRHYHWTMPWGENGQRILPAASYDKYSADMRLLRADVDRAVATFCAEFPTLAARARSELGSLYDAADYPSDIASLFKVSINIMPLPDADDFRVDLPSDAIEEIRSNISRELERTTTEAMREPLSRLFERIHYLADKMSDDDARIYSGPIEALRDLCEVLPSFNITSDATLDDFIKRSRELIENLDADVLREMPERRTDVAKQASQIESDMAAYMGVFGK